jgi:LysM repeat protein
VAADFIGAEVMCPSCKETLRLPKTPEEVPPQSFSPEKPPTSPPPPAITPVQQPARNVDQPPDTGPPVRRVNPSTNSRRLALALAVLLPMLAVAGALLFFLLKEPAPEHIALGKVSPLEPSAQALEKPAPPPPPVAVSEMPVPPPPSLPQPEENPVPEVAVVQPVPEPATATAGAVAEEIENASAIPEPSPEPAAALPAPDPALVEAIPATPAPEPAARPEPEPAAPAELVHTIARGDTLGKLARKYQVGAAAIRKANGMKSDAVMLGQKLKIPGAIQPAAETAPPAVAETPATAPQEPRTHTVVRGDTLDRIARKHRVTQQQIMQANGMKNDVVRLGRKLVIPAAP